MSQPFEAILNGSTGCKARNIFTALVRSRSIDLNLLFSIHFFLHYSKLHNKTVLIHAHGKLCAPNLRTVLPCDSLITLCYFICNNFTI